MWTQEQLASFGQAVEALGRLVETLEGLVGNLEERLEMADGRLQKTVRNRVVGGDLDKFDAQKPCLLEEKE